MLGRLRFGSHAKKPFGKDYRDCVEKIKERHAQIMMRSDENTEDAYAVYNDSSIEAICDRADDFGDDVIGYAAFALEYLVVFHPFVDGNKRTAFAIMMKILHDGGYRLRDNEETQNFVIGVAEGKYDRDSIEDWLRGHVILIRRVF